jgi:hypothetical protein
MPRVGGPSDGLKTPSEGGFLPGLRRRKLLCDKGKRLALGNFSQPLALQYPEC